MKNIAAFFDIDGTLYREGLIAEVFKKLVKCEIIPSEKWYKDVRPEYLKWDTRKGDYDNYLIKMAEIFVEAIKGIHESQIEFIAKKVVEQKGDRVYTFTRDRIKWHKEQGHKIITISGSPVELVKEMAHKYGFDDYKGAVYVKKNAVYTGEVIPMWDSQSKKEAIMEFTKKYDIDLKRSYAYGDTSGDLSMFQLVSKPICINPNKELITKVLSDDEVKNKISIIVERKDVVYNITSDNIHIVESVKE
ncbi:HAD-IB family hydrolase [Haloimpatiens sp. FM7315]|uniref:HAD-IB family hydrolase n=1 Tax=Haloimpatiens sp. FM7315 TaxID=3298609 RepID=UPI0035A274B6